MSKWLSRLKKLESPQLATDKTDKNCCSVGSVSSKSASKQKIKLPKVWVLEVATNGEKNKMTVIDPERLNNDDFLKTQIAIFGEDRIISFNEKKESKN